MSKLQEVLNRYRQLGIDQQLDYAKLYLYSIITHSTAIEGSTVTEIENQLLFDEGLGTNKPIIEQMMNLDLKKAYEAARKFAETHGDITAELLCRLSALVMKNTGTEYNTFAGSFNSSAGELRLINVSAGRGGRSYLAWQKIPDRLQKFCDWPNERRKALDSADLDGIYELSFEAHYKLVLIHPWADGNGRMSRLVMNMIQYEFAVVPSIVKKERRAAFIASLAEARENEDPAVFLDFMRNEHIRGLEDQIADYLRSQDDI